MFLIRGPVLLYRSRFFVVLEARHDRYFYGLKSVVCFVSVYRFRVLLLQLAQHDRYLYSLKNVKYLSVSFFVDETGVQTPIHDLCRSDQIGADDHYFCQSRFCFSKNQL